MLLAMAAVPHAVVIDARYSLHASFRDTFVSTETVLTSGPISRTYPQQTTIDRGAIRIWRLPDDGRFLVSRAQGAYLETIQHGGVRSASKKTFNATSEFDALGYAKNGAAGIADLIPIFPGRPVRLNDAWRVSSRISSPYGDGTAAYVYRVNKIWRASSGHVLARFTVQAHALLKPGAKLRMAQAHAAVSGYIVWDCTEHERAFSHTHVIYEVHGRAGSSTDEQTEDDSFTRI